MLNKIFTIAFYTFKELLKSKILYITLFLGVCLVLVTFVATEFTYGVPEKIALDFGLGMLSLSSLAISLFMGANLLSKEIDSRTVYMVVSRPVPRWTFITGKILGLVVILAINIGLLSLITILCSSFLGGVFSQTILMTILFNFLESVLLLLVVVLFSMFTNSILSSAISLVILLLGHAVKETQTLTFVENREIFKVILKFYHFILPAFYRLNFKDFVIYNQSIATGDLISGFLYCLCYSVFLFLVIIFLFNKKNLD